MHRPRNVSHLTLPLGIQFTYANCINHHCEIGVTSHADLSIYTGVVVEINLRKKFEQALNGEPYKAAWRYSWRLCGEYEAAQDLLQETLAHAYIKFSQLRTTDKFRGWLLNIVRTQYLMRIRQASRQPRIVSESEIHNSAAPPMQPAHEGMPPQIAAAYARLPKLQREAMELHYIDGLNLEEAAQVLGIKPNAVKARLHRGREVMKKALGVVSAQISLQGGQTDEQ